MNADDEKLINSDDAVDFLGLSAFRSTDLKAAGEFVPLYLKMTNAISEQGAMAVLESIL